VRGALVRERLLELGEGSIRGGAEAAALIDREGCDLLKVGYRGPNLCLQSHLLVCDASLHGCNLRGANRLLGIKGEVSFDASTPSEEL
jgi:hypothetical protein